MQTVVEQCQQVVGNDAFQDFIICVAQANPKAVELRAAQKSFTLGLEIIGELTHKVDGSDASQRNLLMLALLCEQIDGIGLGQPGGIEVTAHDLLVGKLNDDFLVRRGWGAVFQGRWALWEAPICEFREGMLC